MTAIWPTSYIIRFSYLEAMSTFILLSFDNIVDILSKEVVVLIVFNTAFYAAMTIDMQV